MSRGLKDGEAAADLFQQVPQQAPRQLPAVDHEGHRQRLKARFLNGEELPDYELLELLLFAIPRIDTKPIAKALLRNFDNSFAEIIRAPSDRLKEVKGVGDAVVLQLRLVRAAAVRLMQAEIKPRDVLGSWDAVVAYCRSKIGSETIERFHILFLDKKNQIIADEVQQTGTVDHAPVYPRQVVKRALELAATAIILVHNHPSGDPTPSRADVETTRQIVDAARPLGIAVHDHIIVGPSRHASLRQLKLM